MCSRRERSANFAVMYISRFNGLAACGCVLHYGTQIFYKPSGLLILCETAFCTFRLFALDLQDLSHIQRQHFFTCFCSLLKKQAHLAVF